MKLKLLTLNLHCLVEEELKSKQVKIANEIAARSLDIIFLQEVAQTHTSDIVSVNPDNYALTLVKLLREHGLNYHFYFEPIKKSFNIYDEGLAILSKVHLDKSFSRQISKVDSYESWKRRKVLAYHMYFEGKKITLATTHFGWTDEVEVFEKQFELATESKDDSDIFILAGDYNIYPESKEYKYILRKNWKNLSRRNHNNKYSPTFRGGDDTHFKEVRLDYIMSNKKINVLNEEIVFIIDRVSDHYGLVIEIEL